MAVTGFGAPPHAVPFNFTSITHDSARKKAVEAMKNKLLQLAAKAKGKTRRQKSENHAS